MKVKEIKFFIASFLLISVMFVSVASADGKYPVRIIEQSIIVFPVDESTLQVVHIASYENNGVEKEVQLPVYLPRGHSQLELREGIELDQVQLDEKGFIDLEGLEPGSEKRIVISYMMPMNSRKSIWTFEQAYVTEKFEVVIPSGILSFEAMNLLTQSQLFEMNGQEFRRFTRLDLHPNEPWSLSFRLIEPAVQKDHNTQKFTSDGKKIFGHGHGTEGYVKAVITLLIIIIALSVAWVGLKRDYLSGSRRKTNQIDRNWLRTEKSLLFQQIGKLEQDYLAKLIGQETYFNTRKEIRDKIIRIALELRKENKTK